MHDDSKTGGSLDANSDDSFDALLKRAAHVSGPKVASLGVQLHPGSTLLDGRLRIVKRIGEGGMGVVYAAFDEQRRSTVALKTLNRLDAANVYRLKNEFRSLADVSHPNLCHLHELFGDAGQWFFTMELIDGERFDQHVRPNDALDEARLRAVLLQLIDGIEAIHNAGKLHRDLKPSNVLVTRDGRVVILDFGLAMDSELGGVGHTVRETSVSGTPGYMAPEQAAGQPATTASDYYALGAMLFEALTGKLPFDGRVHEMLVDKQRNDAPTVASVGPTASPDLAALCDALLMRDPGKRNRPATLPSAPRAAAPRTAALRSVSPARGNDDTTGLLGRDAELDALRQAYRATHAGRSVALFVSGESGVGKSALVDAFLGELRDAGDAVVLAGRCYERESVPYKAFDTLVDELSRYLRKLSREDAGDLMPREVFALSRLFPVLDRVDAIAHAPKKEIPDPQELQQRAFAAFGELLGRIRDRRPLVVYIDDLQWADQDSTVFMAYLLAHRDPIPALLIASHRSEGAVDNGLLQQTLRNARKNEAIDSRSLAVERLSQHAAQTLVQRSLGPGTAEHVAAIAAESQGSPFFIGELVRQVRASGAGPTRLTLHQAVLRHVLDLGSDARALIDVLAVAGRPLPVQLALDAANTTHDTVDTLLSERLLRGTGAGHERTLECYHDKIRETVAASLNDADLKQVHRQLAVTLARHVGANPEHLALHWHGAGDTTQAATHYEQAGDVSSRALAFDYAARQYEQALGLFEGNAVSVRALRVKLAAALAAAGRSHDAAVTYVTAAKEASPERALDHTRTAAHLLLTSGYLDEGRVLIGEVLNAIGLSLPRSRAGSIASAAWSVSWLKLRGLALREGHKPVDDVVEMRLRTMWAIVQGAIFADPFLMVDMLARYTRLALDVGSVSHSAQALASQAHVVSFGGAATRPQTEQLLSRARELARRAPDPAPIGVVLICHGASLMNQGRFAECRELNATAIDWLAQHGTMIASELSAARATDFMAATCLGQFAEVAATAPKLVEGALRRGEPYSAMTLFTMSIIPCLANHGLADTRARFDMIRKAQPPQPGVSQLDIFVLGSALSMALYEGNGEVGLQLAHAQWPSLQQSQVLRVGGTSAYLWGSRSACALLALRKSGGPSKAEQKIIQRGIRTLRTSTAHFGQALASLLEAGVAIHERRLDHAAERLRFTLKSFEDREMRMHAAAARRRLGQLIGGDEGRALVAAGDAAMASESVLDVEATTEMLVPGCRS